MNSNDFEYRSAEEIAHESLILTARIWAVALTVLLLPWYISAAFLLALTVFARDTVDTAVEWITRKEGRRYFFRLSRYIFTWPLRELNHKTTWHLAYFYDYLDEHPVFETILYTTLVAGIVLGWLLIVLL